MATSAASPSDRAQLTALLCCSTKEQAVRLIEEHAPRFSLALGSVALHVLANIVASSGVVECTQTLSMPAVNSLLLQLGSQLSGGSLIDAQGLTCMLWALARMGIVESPLVQGLLTRLLLLISHGSLDGPQLNIVTQAFAKLGMLSTSAGATLATHLHHSSLRHPPPRYAAGHRPLPLLNPDLNHSAAALLPQQERSPLVEEGYLCPDRPMWERPSAGPYPLSNQELCD
uniref:Uncharacterized protein n=1 Tax=Coccolithus braarudii TaxID=221442 RepID=A0A7S0PVF3_9EUKA|mmetsp:Transcript_16094/g.34924  ORF Transcript_16094/g.34924 Transcript_16094/m.34924 type:complete len:229 (+) Transcript_16094:16-702(+)